MKPIIIYFLLFFSITSFGQESVEKMKITLEKYVAQKTIHISDSSIIIDLNRGKISAPKNCKNKKTGTKDSERGQLKIADFLIEYDIGFSAGTFIHSGVKDDYVWYKKTILKGNDIIIGLQKTEHKTTLVVTVYGDLDTMCFPANFRAEVKNETDIKTLLDIAVSYEAKL